MLGVSAPRVVRLEPPPGLRHAPALTLSPSTAASFVLPRSIVATATNFIVPSIVRKARGVLGPLAPCPVAVAQRTASGHSSSRLLAESNAALTLNEFPSSVMLRLLRLVATVSLALRIAWKASGAVGLHALCLVLVAARLLPALSLSLSTVARSVAPVSRPNPATLSLALSIAVLARGADGVRARSHAASPAACRCAPVLSPSLPSAVLNAPTPLISRLATSSRVL